MGHVTLNQTFGFSLRQALLNGRHGQSGSSHEIIQAEALFQAQCIEHVFKGQVFARHLFMLSGWLSLESLRHVKLRLSKANLPSNAMRKTELAVGASTYAQVVAKLPVVEVVPTPVAWLGVSRHLVPF